MRRPHITRRAGSRSRASSAQPTCWLLRLPDAIRTDAGTILTVSPSKALGCGGRLKAATCYRGQGGIGMRATTRDHALHVGMATFLVIVAFLTPSAKAAAASTGDATSALQTVDCSTGNLILRRQLRDR